MEPSLNEHNSVGGENLMLQVALPWGQRVWIELPAPRLHGLALQSPHQQNKVTCVCSVTQLCSTLCDPVDCSAPGSSVHGILQVRIVQWVAISSSRGSSRPRDQTHIWQVGSLLLSHHGTRRLFLLLLFFILYDCDFSPLREALLETLLFWC